MVTREKPLEKHTDEAEPTDPRASALASDAGEGVESTASDESRAVALAVAKAGLDKKARAIELIDVSDKVDYAELLVLMSGRSDRHVHAIARGVQEELKKTLGVVPLSVEGMTVASWVLLDFNHVVVHVFQEETRLYYDLEGLWIDASRVSIPSPPDRPTRSRS
jgi:ribosome-associated protein